MKKFIFLFFVSIFMNLLNYGVGFAERSYLFENFYYNMNIGTIKEKISLLSSDKNGDVYSGETRVLSSIDFETFFVFKNKKLKEVFLMKNYKDEPQKYTIMNNNEYFYGKATEFINQSSTVFMYSTLLKNYYLSIPMKELEDAIKSGLIISYAIGKSNYYNSKNKASLYLKDFIKNIDKSKKLITLTNINDSIIISFKIFKDEYKKGKALYSIVDGLLRSSQ